MTGTINAYGELFSGAKITPAIKAAAQKAANYGKLRLQSRSPVRSGDLRKGWQVELEGYGARIVNDVPYTLYNEMGTRLMKARPMVAPTIPEMQEVFKKELAKSVGKALGKKIVGSLGDNATVATSTKDESAFQALTQGKNPTTPGLGFRNTGAKPKALNYSQTQKYAKGQGKAFPSPPGKLQSPKARKAGAL